MGHNMVDNLKHPSHFTFVSYTGITEFDCVLMMASFILLKLTSNVPNLPGVLGKVEISLLLSTSLSRGFYSSRAVTVAIVLHSRCTCEN